MIVGMRLPILLPQQLQAGVAVRGQLVVNLGEIGQRPPDGSWSGPGGPEQHFLQPLVVTAIRQRPGQPGLLEADQILADGALAELDAARDLPLRQLQLEGQPQHVVDLSHGDSLSGHPFIRRDTR